MHSNVTIKNISWPHFSWATLYTLCFRKKHPVLILTITVTSKLIVITFSKHVVGEVIIITVLNYLMFSFAAENQLSLNVAKVADKAMPYTLMSYLKSITMLPGVPCCFNFFVSV